eukprot:gene4660-6548_t
MTDTHTETAAHPSNQLLMQTIKKRAWHEACRIVYNDESYSRIKDFEGYLPLHAAVRFGPPTELITLLLTAYPKSIQERDPEGNLPMHLASYHSQDKLWLDLYANTTLLYNSYPQGLCEFDAHGNLPIHLAIRNRAPYQLTKFMLESFPHSATIPDKYGSLPLHLCAQFDDNIFVISELFKVYPKGLNIKTKKGALPLHRACQFNPNFDVIEYIFTLSPESATEKDDRENTPIHLAFLSCAGTPNELLLKMILNHCPTCLNLKNKQDCTPFMMMSQPSEHDVNDYL